MKKGEVELRFKALGTEVYLNLILEKKTERAAAEEILRKAKKIYFDQEKIFSRFAKESELSLLNKKTGKFNDASSDILEISRLALEYNLQTKGIFDPRIIEALESFGYKNDFYQKNFQANLKKKLNISGKLAKDLKIKNGRVFFGTRMDFSGIAKGYITDKVADFFRSKGWENFLIDSGGDIFAAGFDQNGEKWKVSLEGMSEERMLMEISNEAVATSGITRRKWKVAENKFHHLINPKDIKKFNFDLQSVTVIAKKTVQADVLAKTVFLLGRNKGTEFSKNNKIKSLFLDYRGNLFIT